MAKGKFTGGKHFEPGNQYGKRKTLPADVKAMRKLTRAEVIEKLSKYLHLEKRELKKIKDSVNTPMLDLMVISVIEKASSLGDDRRLNFLLENTVGKLQNEVKLEGDIKVSAHKELVDILNGSKSDS